MSFGHNGGPALDPEDSGWIAMARSVRNHHLVGMHVFVQPANANRGAVMPLVAWMDLIMECRFADGTVINNGKKMTLRRGQLLGANSWLADRWNWTPKTVRGFLARLEDDGMISLGGSQPAPGQVESETGKSPGTAEGRSKGRFANVLTICNYSQYQMPIRVQGQVEGQAEGRLRAGWGGEKGDNYNNGYNNSNKERESVSPRAALVETKSQAQPEGPLQGEEDIGHGVYASTKTIRHAEFVISVDGVVMQTLNCGLTRNETEAVCRGIAIQWALDLESGKPIRQTVPSNVANFLAVAVRRAASDRAQQGVRMARTARGHDNREQAERAETQAQAMKRKFAEAERAAVAKEGIR